MNEKEIKLEHFKNLVAVANADGIFDESELEFLSERAIEIGLKQEEVDEIIKNADKLQFMVPMNKEDREDQLSDIVFMSMIDGSIHEKEYGLCLNISKRLDLGKKYLDHVIELTKKLWKFS